MGKKKFIDKNKSRTFKLVQSSNDTVQGDVVWKDITSHVFENIKYFFIF